MMLVACQCDWGIGLTIPHHHRKLEKLRLEDGRELWLPGGAGRLNPEMEVLMEWYEVGIRVDWKNLYRALTEV